MSRRTEIMNIIKKPAGQYLKKREKKKEEGERRKEERPKGKKAMPQGQSRQGVRGRNYTHIP